jgi:hypothetical protein
VAFFLLSTFAAALVAGLAGFAFGLVAAAVWLHILTPVQTASLIIAFGLAEPSNSSKQCRDQQQACAKNYSAKTCTAEYDIGLKSCRK